MAAPVFDTKKGFDLYDYDKDFYQDELYKFPEDEFIKIDTIDGASHKVKVGELVSLEAKIGLVALKKTCNLIDNEKIRQLEDLTGINHLAHLANIVTAVGKGHVGISPVKIGRWLGWTQSILVASGCATIKQINEINGHIHD